MLVLDVMPAVMEVVNERGCVILNQICMLRRDVSHINTVTVPNNKILAMHHNVLMIDNYDRSVLTESGFAYNPLGQNQLDLLLAYITRVDQNVFCKYIPFDYADLRRILKGGDEYLNPDVVAVVHMAVAQINRMNRDGHRTYWSSREFVHPELRAMIDNNCPKAKDLNSYEFNILLNHQGTINDLNQGYKQMMQSQKGESFNRPSMVPPGFIPQPSTPPTPSPVSFSAPPKQPCPVFKTAPFPSNGQVVAPGTPVPPPMPMGRDYMPLVLKQEIEEPKIPVVFTTPKPNEQKKPKFASPDHVGGILNAILSSDNANVTNGAVGAFVNGDGQIMLSYEDGSISPPINNQLVGIKYDNDDDCA